MNDLAAGLRTTDSSDGAQARAMSAWAPIASMSASERVRVALARSLLKTLVEASMYDIAIDASSTGTAEVAHRLLGQRRIAQASFILKCLSIASMYDTDIDSSSAGVCEVVYRLIDPIVRTNPCPENHGDSRAGVGI